MADENLHGNTNRLLVRAKPDCLKRVVDNLSDVQRQWVVETGFEKVLLFNIKEYPQPLSFIISKSYNPIDSSISIGENIVNFSEEDVQNILGLPKGGLMFENSYNTEYRDVWRSQFKDYMYPHKISAEVICDALKSSELVNLEFKLNFLIILTNVLIEGSRTPYVSSKILSYSGDLDQCFIYNWCGYLLQCLAENFEHWIINPSKQCFIGSVPFLVVCFLDRIMEREKNVMDSTHALTYWTTERLQKIDIAHFYSGKIAKMGEVIKSVDPHTTKCETGMMQRQQIAMEVIKKVCADIDHDYGCGVDVENEVIFQYLREAVDKLENLQLQHFKLFTAANLRYHSDNIIDVLKNRFINLNEEAIDFVLGVLSSSEHSGRKSTEISNYKKDVATEHNITNWNKEYVWEWLNSNEADDAVVFKWNQISCTKEDIRSLNFGKDVSVGAIDAWCCLLNLKEKSMPNAFKHRLFCFLDTTANITHPGKVVDDVGLLHEFGDKVEQTLQTFNFAMSNINMVFFPIYSCKHYYTVCYDISEPSIVVLDNSSSGGLGTSLYGRTLELLHNNFVEFLKMKNHPSVLKLQWVEPVTLNLPWNTKFNTADSGVFLMRHMETYFGGDGLFLAEKFVEESHLQQHQLNKLRFEYARLMICTSINEQRGNVMDIMESWHSANTASHI